MIPERYVMVLLCSLCCFINYADRVNMSIAIISIAEEYKFTIRQQGVIMSIFFMGYLPMQIGGAVLCRRFGGKNVLSYGSFLWSLFTILTPFASSMGYYPLLLCRVFMGLSEGVAFPGVFHFLSSWIPASERGRAISIFLSGVHVGTTAALILSPLIIRWHSWQLIFYTFGAAGFVWIFAWNLIAYDRDNWKEGDSGSIDDDAQTSRQEDSKEHEDHVVLLERDSTTEGRRRTSRDSLDGSPPTDSPDTRASSSTAKQSQNQGVETLFPRALSAKEFKFVAFVLSDRRCLALCFTQAMFGFIHYTILSWLPSYFKNVFDAETTSLSFTFLPYLTMAVSSGIGGIFGDFLVGRGYSLTRARKIVTVIANTGAGVLLILFSLSRNVPTALVCVSLSMAFMSLNSGGFESLFLDMVSPGVTGMFKAVANTMASFSGFIAIPFATLVLQWSGNSWRFVFGSLSVWYAVLMGVFCGFASSDRIWTEESR